MHFFSMFFLSLMCTCLNALAMRMYFSYSLNRQDAYFLVLFLSQLISFISIFFFSFFFFEMKKIILFNLKKKKDFGEIKIIHNFIKN